METLSHSTTYTESVPFSKKYAQFVEDSEFNRTGWTATALMIQGCILSPSLLLSMFYLGGGDWQFLTGMLCFLLVIVPILGAQKMKYIFGGFFLSLAIHVAIIGANLLGSL